VEELGTNLKDLEKIINQKGSNLGVVEDGTLKTNHFQLDMFLGGVFECQY